MNFDKVIDRRGTYCTQWDFIEDRFGKGNGELIPFSISDTDFQAPKEIIDGIIKYTEHGIFGYSRWNHHDYKDSIVNWYKKRNNTVIEEDWVVYSPSVLYSVSSLLEQIVEPKGKVITHTPKYDGFTKILQPYEIYEVQLVEKEKGVFETDFDEIEKGFKLGAKAFLLCNPQNPTGKVWEVEELKKIMDLVKKYNAILISDEIHMDVIRKTATSVLSICAENTVVVNSPSKTFNVPSLGGSYAIIPDKAMREKFLFHMKQIDSVSSPTIFGVLSTIIGYNQCDYWVDELNRYIENNCNYVIEQLDGYKGLEVYMPDATYLMWIGFRNSNIEPEEFQKALINKGKVAIMPGKIYGDPYKIRFNVGCPISKLKIGVEGIKKSL
ncbi:MalY/PatB family protein [Tissierellaceae bacterium HCP3S3_D8]